MSTSRITLHPNGHAPFQPPVCEICGDTMYVTDFLPNPDTDVGDVDWHWWTCLLCEEDGEYALDQRRVEEFRRNLALLREQARHAGDDEAVLDRERRRDEQQRR